MKSYRPPAVLLTVMALLCLAAAARAELIYPLAAPPVISGNFGQYRHGHPHSGLDLWTGLRIGVPVLAVDDGVVYRIKQSSAGYGRSLYLRLADGRQAVYGHLESFAPRLAQVLPLPAAGLIRAEKVLSSAEAIAVKRGEVIGYAGDAGTDVPHLHFELRDAAGTPINPLTNGFPYRDTTAPVFNALHLRPLEATAQVSGEPRERILTFTSAGAGEYRLPPVWLSGRVGLAVDAADRIDGSPRRLAPYELRLTIDGRPYFLQRFAQTSYSIPYANELCYDARLVAEQKGYFIRLYRWLQSTYFQGPNDSGDLSALAPGRHSVELTATDESGNRARAAFDLLIAPACTINHLDWLGTRQTPRLDVQAPGCREVQVAVDAAPLPGASRQPADIFRFALTQSPAPGSTVEVTARGETGPPVQARYFAPGPNRDPVGKADVLSAPAIEWGDSFALIGADITRPDAGLPRVAVTFEPGSQLVPTSQWRLYRNGDRLTLVIPQPSRFKQSIRVRFRWSDRRGDCTEQEISFPFNVARNSGYLTAGDQAVRLEIPADALFREVPLTIAEANPSAPDWGRLAGKAYSFSAAWEPLKKDLVAHFRLAGETRGRNLGAYLFDRGTWWYLGSPARAKLPMFGTIALLQDLEAPRIEQYDVGSGEQPVIKIIATDRGSGIDNKRIGVSLDGRDQPFEYWPLKDQLLVRLGGPLAPGAHRLQVELRDRSGNPAVFSSNFTK
ncbi:MAG: M23 family metallopeptidase [Myxococcales bacterium]|nr:M23 family metallopeptidase [Myxococcales bacterium]